MIRWRGPWAGAQITGVIFSSLVWIVVCGLSLPTLVVTAAIGVALVIGRNTRPMLWWRFGARPANDFQRDAMLTAIVPIASLRGRHQPSIWTSHRLGGLCAVMPTRTDLVVSLELTHDVVARRLTDRQASAIISQAVSHPQILDSNLAAAFDSFCMPWRLVAAFTGAASQITARIPLIRFSWTIRWIVLGLAATDSYRNTRWPALVGVVLIAVLSATTGRLEAKWLRTLEELADRSTVAEGLGPDLADLIQHGDQSLAGAERANRLRNATTESRSARTRHQRRCCSVERRPARARTPAHLCVPETEIRDALRRGATGCDPAEAGIDLVIPTSTDAPVNQRGTGCLAPAPMPWGLRFEMFDPFARLSRLVPAELATEPRDDR